MNDTRTRNAGTQRYRSRSLLTVMAVAVAIVALLVFIQRSEHFQIRPVSGAANAISQAATPAQDPVRHAP